MKRALILFLLILFSVNIVFGTVQVYSENNKFGLKNGSEKITDAKYKKLVKLGDSAWIMQDGTKFGIIRDSGRVIVEPKYTQAERVLGRFAKFGRGDKYGIYDEMGFEILPVEYSSIDLLYGGLFVTSKNYLYGITDLNGQMVLDNIYDDIYMPDFKKLVLVYRDELIEVDRSGNNEEELNTLSDLNDLRRSFDVVKVSDLTSNPIAGTGYYSVTVTDYILKLISSISPAYEQTIDELMFSQGADTVSVLVKCTWIPRFPFVYAKKYYKNIVNPYSGPLSKLKRNLKNKTLNQ